MIAAVVEERYRFLRPLDDGRFEVADLRDPEVTLVATLHAPPAGRVGARIAEERRLLSWLRHPGLVVPHDLFLDESGVWSVTRPPPGPPARDADPTVDDVLRWSDALCEVLGALQRAPRRPLPLVALSPDSVRVTADRRLVLVGFELDADLRLVHRGGAWQAPAGPGAGVWLVGRFLADLLEHVPARGDARVRSLRALARRILDAARPPRSLFLLRRALARAAALPAPPPPRGRLVDVRTLATAVLLLGLLSGLGGAVWTFPEGLFGGTEGVVGGVDALVSPGGHRCVAWSARVTRVLERQTWDAEAREYRMARYERVLLDRSAAAPFTLDGRPVRGAVLLPEAQPAELSRVPQGLDPGVRPGEHVIAIRGYELYIRAGDVAHVHGASSSQGGVPGDGAIIVRQGTRLACVARAVWSSLPWLLLAGCCACGLAALEQKGRHRGRAGREAQDSPRRG